MAIRTLPVWTIPPNWSSPVIEGLGWLTSILASVQAAEQRQQLRVSPRKSLEFIVQASGRQRTYFDALLSAEFQTEFYLPIWYEVGRMTRAVAPGETWLIVEGARQELSETSILFLQGPEPYLFELVEVDTSSTLDGKTTFSLTAGFVNAWPRGTKIYPAKSAMLSEQPSFQRLNDRTISASLGFVITEPNDWDHDAGLDTYLSFPVVSFEINEGDNQSGGYARVSTDVDNQTGIPVRQDIAGIPFFKTTSAGFFSGRTNTDQFRSLLYALKGRLSAAWFVSPNSDFTLAAPASTGAASLVVERSGFSDLGTPVAGREDIRILTRGGGTSFHRITGSALLSETHESLNISPVLPGGLSLVATKRISFMSLGRLDQDRVDLTHVTDQDGVCSFSIVTKAVPDLRIATDWTPPALLYAEMGDCSEIAAHGDYYNPTLISSFPATVNQVTMVCWADFSGSGFQMGATCGVDPVGAGTSRNGWWTFMGAGDQLAVRAHDGHAYGIVDYMGTVSFDFSDITGAGWHLLVISIDAPANIVQATAFPAGVDPSTVSPKTPIAPIWHSTNPMLGPGSAGTGTLLGTPIIFAPAGDGVDTPCADQAMMLVEVFLDMTSPTDRAKVISSTGRPVGFGADGTGTGLAPEIYLTVLPGESEGAFRHNRGSYGDGIFSPGGDSCTSSPYTA